MRATNALRLTMMSEPDDMGTVMLHPPLLEILEAQGHAAAIRGIAPPNDASVPLHEPLARASILLVIAAIGGCAAPPAPPSAEPPTIIVSAPPRPASPPPPQATAPVASASTPKEAPNPCAPGARADVDRLTDAIPGHFSAPDAEERAGELPCRPDDAVEGFALLRRNGDTWTVARFVERSSYRVTRSGCRPLPLQGGRDLLVCQDTTVNSGVIGQRIVVIDYARPPGDDTITLLTLGDDTSLACDNLPPGADALAGTIERVEVRDVNGDGARDLRVTVSAGMLHVPRCPASGSPKLGSPPTYVLDFIARGESLAPSPKSAAILARIAAVQR